MPTESLAMRRVRDVIRMRAADCRAARLSDEPSMLSQEQAVEIRVLARRGAPSNVIDEPNLPFGNRSTVAC